MATRKPRRGASGGRSRPIPRRTNYLVVTATGKDRAGLVADLCAHVSALGLNIIDVEQRSTHGLFMLFMVVEVVDPSTSERSARQRLQKRTKGFDVEVRVDLLPIPDFERKKNMVVFTIIGKDKIGILRALTGCLSNFRINIERIHHLARGDFVALEVLLDAGDLRDLTVLKDALNKVCAELGVDAVIEPESPFRVHRRLIVFDMDGTLIEGEMIDELARAAGVADRVAGITRKAMAGELEFSAALRERVRLLKGLDVRVLHEVAASMQLQPGAQELVTTLKEMGFKVALVSGGFSFFTDRLREQLGLDYTFANELLVQEGRLTGAVREPIIDAAGKGRIVEELRQKEGLRKEEVVAVGDGANDTIMLKNAGLGVAFNAKDVLKRVADASVSKENLAGLLYCLGAGRR